MRHLDKDQRQRFGQAVDDKGHVIGFFLCPSFTMLPFVSALEPLRVANRIAGRSLYRWRLLSADGHVVQASNGMTISPDGHFEEDVAYYRVFVTGPFDPHGYRPRRVLDWLRRLAGHEVALGGLETGTFLLARAGLLRDRRCTTHWENLEDLKREFPGARTSMELFEFDRQRFSCAGGTAALDLSLALIELDYGPELSTTVAETFIYQNVRPSHQLQRMTVGERTGLKNRHLLKTIALMESNLEQPLTMQALAAEHQLSTRQLERLFKRYLATTPARYYLSLRLGEARRLVVQTGMAITEVALACGFTSAGHFSHCYKRKFGVSPRTHRGEQNVAKV